MRARQPDRCGTVERDGVTLAYEVFGEQHSTTMLFLPTWSIVHSRIWKAQVAVLPRAFRVVTFDGRGNGASDRPDDPRAYTTAEFVADAVAVLDETGTDRAVAVGLSLGAQHLAALAAEHPERVLGACFVAGGVMFPEHGVPEIGRADFNAERDAYLGWEQMNRYAWERDYRGFLEFFFGECLPEAHSTKQTEDSVRWGLDTDARTLTHTVDGQRLERPLLGDDLARVLAQIQCPTLHIHGDDDRITPHAWAVALAEALGGDLVTIESGGHLPQARHPVLVNRLLREFAERLVSRPSRRSTWTRSLQRPMKALYVSSPIGLGHAQRDVAIAEALRELRPDLHIDWLAQHPVTTVLEGANERIHPASSFLASESAHIESECHEHDLHAFQALRDMDEILLSNFSVFQDLLAEEHYDLVVADEAWDLDFFLHENPELKRSSFAWITDFVGWIPMEEGGQREAALTTDYNAEMIEHIARFKRIRDRSIFVGNPEDIVPDTFGPNLPSIRSWTEEHFDFSGYVTGFTPLPDADRSGLRRELGYQVDEQVCVVTVGGTGVGASLLRKVIAAYRPASELVDGLRMIVIAGPRIDPATLDAPAGVEVRAFVPRLYEHLSVCDIAIVQGGLTTTMELTASRRPFLYFPLARHFEQQHHVRHRLDHYGAGHAMDYATSTPDDIAEALAKLLAAPVAYRPVETDGAQRAAAFIAQLL